MSCGVDVQSISNISADLLSEFGLVFQQDILYLEFNKTKWPLQSRFTNDAHINEVNTDELSKEIAENKIDSILDIREQYEHQEGELNDYLSMPSTQIKNIPAHRLLNEFLVGNLSQQQHYVLVCRSGRRSMISCQLLNSFGLNKVTNLVGGVALL